MLMVLGRRIFTHFYLTIQLPQIVFTIEKFYDAEAVITNTYDIAERKGNSALVQL